MKKKLSILILIIVLTSCSTLTNLIRKNKEFHIATVNNNVCKRLYGEVVLYAIFVDSKYTNPWTAFDINSTLDSVRLAMQWIEQKASESGVPLNIKIDYHQDKKKIIPIEANLRGKLYLPPY